MPCWRRDQLRALRAELVEATAHRLALDRVPAEFFLDSGTVERFLQGARFSSDLITRAFLGLEYEPGKGYPVFELELVRA
jgi:hypothetical protein